MSVLLNVALGLAYVAGVVLAWNPPAGLQFRWNLLLLTLNERATKGENENVDCG